MCTVLLNSRLVPIYALLELVYTSISKKSDFFFAYLPVASRGYLFWFYFDLWLYGAQSQRILLTSALVKGSDSLNLPLDRGRELLRRSGERLRGLLWLMTRLHVELIVVVVGFEEAGYRSTYP